MFHNRTFKVFLNLILLILVFSITWVTPVYAATTWTVNSTNSPGDGICNISECTLLEALAIATSGDTIIFDLAYPATINMSNNVYIDKNLTITGPGANNLTIDGVFKQVSFVIYPNRVVSFSGLTFTRSYGYESVITNHGFLSVTDITFSANERHPTGSGGGSIYNNGSLVVSNSTFSGNTVSTTYATSGGGAIYNNGTLEINTSTFTTNNVSGGQVGFGGAIYNTGVIEITNSIFTNNGASSTGYRLYGYGGSIYNLGNLTINLSTITDSHASGSGSGIYNNDNANLLVTSSTFSDNLVGGQSTTDNGGGIFNNGNLTVTAATFVGNYADNGGGIFNNINGTTSIANSTFSTNYAGSGFGGAINNSGISTIANSTISGSSQGGIVNVGILNFTNTIIANSKYFADCYNGGTIGTNVKNFVEDGSCSASFSGNPKLGPLSNYGGTVQTFALLTNSGAINAGDDATCPTIDQRGITRPQGMHCDIGAFELIDTTAPDTTMIDQPAILSNQRTPTFMFSGDDGVGSGIISFMCRLDGYIYEVCTSPFTSPILTDGSHTFDVYAIDLFGFEDASPASYSWTLDSIAPIVKFSTRVNANLTSAEIINFTVIFSESVAGIDIVAPFNDFDLTTSPGIIDAFVGGVTPISDTTYTVSVNTGIGNGTIRLDVVDNNSIVDAASNPLGGVAVGDGDFITGETYTITKLAGGDTTGVFRPGNGLLYLKNANTTGFADVAINYGTGGDYPIAGDWNGDGTATIGIYRNGSFYLRNSNTLGFADIVFAFGTPGDQPVAGDWDGDGVDTIGVYSNGQFLLRNNNSAGTADMSFYLGNPGDVGIAGDWNGDGMDTTGVFRPSNGIIFLKNANTTGFADIALNYGLAGDMPVTGDWNNDGIDTIGVYRNAQFLLRNSNTIGFAEIVFGLGNPGDMPISGNWDGIP